MGKSGERGSGISVLPARHDDDDDDESLWQFSAYLESSDEVRYKTIKVFRLSSITTSCILRTIKSFFYVIGNHNI